MLGLIFLRYADFRFTNAGESTGRQRVWSSADWQGRLSGSGVMFLPLHGSSPICSLLPEGENIGRHINEAMKAVEAENDELKGVLPKTFNKISNSILVSLLKNFSQIEMDQKGTSSGKFTNTFLATSPEPKVRKGGEFFTPTSLVKLIVVKSSSHHGVSSIPRVAQAVCLPRVPTSLKLITRNQPMKFPVMAGACR
ncbi:MAG: hypothetical protein R3C12_18750 [Planctomycetaceae bacterium]